MVKLLNASEEVRAAQEPAGNGGSIIVFRNIVWGKSYLTTGPCSSISLWRSALMVEAAEGEEGPMEEDADGTEAETTEAAAASRSASEETEAEAMVRWTRWYRWSRRCRSWLNVKKGE